MKKIIITAILTLSAVFTASAQRFSIGTNAVDWATFGAANIEASVAVAQMVSFHVGVELNPWTFNAGNPDKQFQVKQSSYWAGVRWWPWHVYSGWWAGVDGRYTVYNGGGIIKRDTEEGDSYGGGLYGGYAIMLSDHWNLDLGFGLWGGWKRYTTYSCPVCGVIKDQGEKAFVVPDARIALMFVF